MRTPSPVLVVALLTLLAGCGAVPPQSSQTPTAAADAPATQTKSAQTPATQTAQAQTARTPADDGWADWNASLPAELPPGVSESSVDADALLAAHRESLADTGFVVTRNASSSAGAGGVRAAVTADRSRVLLRYDTTGPDRRVFLTENRTFVRTERGNDTRVRSGERTENASAVPEDFAFDGRVRTYLDGAAHEPVGTVVRDGRTLVVLEADAGDAREGSDLRESVDGNVTSLRSQALVAPDGTVVAHRAVLVVTAESGDSARYEHRYAVDVGDGSVDRPPWATE